MSCAPAVARCGRAPARAPAPGLLVASVLGWAALVWSVASDGAVQAGGTGADRACRPHDGCRVAGVGTTLVAAFRDHVAGDDPCDGAAPAAARGRSPLARQPAPPPAADDRRLRCRLWPGVGVAGHRGRAALTAARVRVPGRYGWRWRSPWPGSARRCGSARSMSAIERRRCESSAPPRMRTRGGTASSRVERVRRRAAPSCCWC